MLDGLRISKIVRQSCCKGISIPSTEYKYTEYAGTAPVYRAWFIGVRTLCVLRHVSLEEAREVFWNT